MEKARSKLFSSGDRRVETSMEGGKARPNTFGRHNPTHNESSCLLERSMEQSRLRVRSLEHRINALVGRSSDHSQRQQRLNQKLNSIHDIFDDNYQILKPIDIEPTYNKVLKKLAYYEKMPTEKNALKDREESEIIMNEKSYVFGRIDSRLKKLPLKVYLTSSHVSWEFYVDFNKYPDFDNFEVKTIGNCLIVGERFKSSVIYDTSIRFMVFSFGKCRIKIRPEFYISIPQEVDLGASRIERLKNMKPFLNIKLLEGKRQEDERKKRSLKVNKSISDHINEAIDNPIRIALDYSTAIAESVNISRSVYQGADHEQSYYHSSTLSVGLFFYAKKGLKHKIKEQVESNKSRILDVQLRKEELHKESRSKFLTKYQNRHIQGRVKPIEIMGVLTDKILKDVKIRVVLVHVFILAIFTKMDKLVKSHRAKLKLLWAMGIVHRIVKLRRRFRKSTISKDARIQIMVRYGLQLHCKSVSHRYARIDANLLIGKAFKYLSYSAKLNSYVANTGSSFSMIFSRVRRHHETVSNHREMFKYALDQVLNNLPIWVETDIDFSGEKLRHFVYDLEDDIFFYMFNSQLIEYLRQRIDWISREKIEPTKIRTEEKKILAKEAIDLLSKARNFTGIEKRLRSSIFQKYYGKFMVNLNLKSNYASWPSYNHKSQELEEKNKSLKILAPSKTKTNSKGYIREEDTEHHERLKQSIKGKDNEHRMQVFKKLKSMFHFQRFTASFTQKVMTALIYTLWMSQKKDKK